MANFTEAYRLTSAHERGYTNDRIDRGGEIYRGISRIHHPDWAGWAVIDAARREPEFPKRLKSDRSLQASVKKFYKARYWEVLQGDDMPDQGIANELYDKAVNMGLRRAVRFLQSGLNLLNRDEKDYKDLVVDGWFGAKTSATLLAYLKQDKDATPLLKLMNMQQGARYAAIMSADAGQERFARTWLNRI